MKLIPGLLLLILSVNYCFGQAFSLNQGGTSAINYHEEIPYEVVNGKIFVQVVIAGKPHKFMFDTGAPVALNNELASETGARILHKDSVVDAYGNTDSVVFIGVSDLRLGKLVFDNIPSLKGLPPFFACWGVEGVIGSNLLRNSIVYIDPSSHRITLTDRIETIPVDPKKGIPLITNIGFQSDPKIKIQFSKRSDALMGFDTGDGSFMRFSEQYMDGLKKTNAYTILKKGYGANQIGQVGVEKDAEKYMLKFPSLKIGDALFTNVIIATDKNTNPAMGAKLLEYGAVTLDFLHGRFYFNATKMTNDLDEKQWGLLPTIKGDKLVVGVVWEKGPAEVKPGQQILAIDEKECEHVELCDIVTGKLVLIGKESTTLTITVKDEQGMVRKIKINKE